MSNSAVLPVKPYLLRAIYEWCNDGGFTPHVVVQVDSRTIVPVEFVKDGQVVLNIGAEATGRLLIDNEALQCTARFNGVVREIWVPIGRISAIYARENGAGLPFEVEEFDAPDGSAMTTEVSLVSEVPAAPEATSDEGGSDGATSVSKPKGPPKLQRVK